MKYIAYRKGGPTDTSRDYELTDWDDLSHFVDSFRNEPGEYTAAEQLKTRAGRRLHDGMARNCFAASW